MSDGRVPRDEGLAAERTELAWSRSGLAALACVVLLARRLTGFVRTGSYQVLAIALIVFVAAVAGLFALAWRGEQRVDVHTRFRAITAGTLGLAIAGFVLALFPPTD